MRWVVFGTYDKSRHPRVAVLIEGLRASGDHVVEINAPLPLDTAGRVKLLRQPWRVPLVAIAQLRCWARLVNRSRPLRRARSSDGGSDDGGSYDAVLVGYLGQFDVRLARRLFRRTPIVLDHLVSAVGTARDRGLAGSGGLRSGGLRSGGLRSGGLMRRVLGWIDDGALRRADVVVVDTAEHLAALPASEAGKGVIAPVGAAQVWFAARKTREEPRDGPREGSLRVIFVGLFTPLHGAGTIASALAELADDEIEVTMVGTGQDYAAARIAAAANPRVRWIDWVPGAELPALVAEHHVSLGIFGTTAKAANVVPTKVFQGAAAGCAIVTSDTPPQRAALGDAAVFVEPGNARALVAALRTLAADRDGTARLGAAAHDLALARFTPAAVVADLRARTARG